MSKDFYSFERVLRELQMEEEELKRLVSEGEIRAFRDQDKMKFKREDIERWRKGGAGDDTLDVPDDLVFEEDDADQEVGMATAAISDDSFLEEDDAPLELEEVSTKSSSRARPSAAAGSRRPRVQVEPEETEGPVWTTAVVVCAVLALFASIVVSDAVRGQAGGMSGGFKDWLTENVLDVETLSPDNLIDEDGNPK